MSAPESDHEVVAKRIMRRLHDFAVGMGLDEQRRRQIVDQVIKDMPQRPDEDRLDKSASA